jgi:hypothetical protein
MKPSAPESIALLAEIASAAEEILWSCRGPLGPAVFAPQQFASTSISELACSHDSVLLGLCAHFVGKSGSLKSGKPRMIAQRSVRSDSTPRTIASPRELRFLRYESRRGALAASASS